LSKGYNGFPKGIEDDNRLNDDRKYGIVVHAEQNCIYNACLNGVSLKDSTFYIYGAPVCNECAKGIIQVGCVKVHCVFDLSKVKEKWFTSDITTKEMFTEAGIKYYQNGELVWI